MLVIPAIDLKHGRCVRLKQGRADAETVYSEDPLAQARNFAEAGAKRLHLVDLDGAFRGEEGNLNSIREILRGIQVPVQVGGGIRSLADIERMFALGVDSVIIGTMAVKHPEVLEDALTRHHADKILLGLDARDRKVAVEGWQEGTELDDVTFARRWKTVGVNRVIFTDIARDGMLSGPNIEALLDFANRSGMHVTASGGVASLADISRIKLLEKDGVDQVIVGKAIYDGRIRLEEALAC